MLEPDGEATGDKAGRLFVVVVLGLYGALCAFDSFIAGPVTALSGLAAFIYPLTAFAIFRKKAAGALLPPAFGLSMMIYESGGRISILPLLGSLVPASLWIAFFVRMRRVYPSGVTPAAARHPQNDRAAP